MTRATRSRWLIAAALVTAGVLILVFAPSGRRMRVGARADLPTFRLYTAPSATSPQLPLWAAVHRGGITNALNLDVHLWKDMDDLQGLLLAGKGDLWIGHVEGFARARHRGAPVVLLAVTGWRKFHVISRQPISGLEDLRGRALPYTPVGAPAVPLLRGLPGGETIDFQPLEIQPLARGFERGAFDTVMAPEPLASVIIRRDSNAVCSLSVADIYGAQTGRPRRLPVAGVGVHADTLKRYPERIRRLLSDMERGAEWLNEDLQRAARCRPEDFKDVISDDILLESLSRDVIHVESAASVKDEIRRYLEGVAPALFEKPPHDWFERLFMVE